MPISLEPEKISRNGKQFSFWFCLYYHIRKEKFLFHIHFKDRPVMFVNYISHIFQATVTNLYRVFVENFMKFVLFREMLLDKL